MKITVWTSSGKLETILLKDFILKIPVETVRTNDDYRVQYNTLVSQDPSPYIEGEEDKALEIFTEDFIESMETREFESPKDILREIEDRTIDSVVQFGNPSFLVNIESRTWAVVDPKDFKLYISEDGLCGRLVCFAPNRNFICKYERE